MEFKNLTRPGSRTLRASAGGVISLCEFLVGLYVSRQVRAFSGGVTINYVLCCIPAVSFLVPPFGFALSGTLFQLVWCAFKENRFGRRLFALSVMFNNSGSAYASQRAFKAQRQSLL